MTDPGAVELSRTLGVTPARLFSAWTDVDVLRRWCSPHESFVVSRCVLDARVGGGYDVSYGPGPAGTEHHEVATYRELVPDERLVVDQVLTGGGMDERSTTTLTFTAVPGGTRLDVAITGLSGAEAAQLHADGWAGSLAALAAVLRA